MRDDRRTGANCEAKQGKKGGQKNDEGGGGSSRGKAKNGSPRYNGIILFGVLKVLVPKK